MADKEEHDQTEDVDLTEGEAKQLLAPAVKAGEGDEADDVDGVDKLGDAGRRALETYKEQRKAARAERDSAKKEAADLKAKLKKYEDEGKSELQRLQEERDQLRESSSKAASEARAMRVAMDRAPEHATLAQVRAVAKRVRGDEDDDLEQDADELFALLAPEPKAATKTPSRPKERLKGGSEPDEEPEETDPRKLAAMVPRRR